MRIIFIAPFGFGQKTTAWARTLPLAKALVQRGHTVCIAIPPWDTPTDSGRSWVDEGVQIENVRLTGGLPFVLWRMVRLTRRFAPDVLHVVKPRAHAGLVHVWFWWWRRLAGWFSAKGTQPRIFLDLDDWEQAWATINGYHPLLARFLAWQEEWGIRHADGITAASRWLAKRAQQYSPQTPTLYLPNGVTLPPTLAAANALPSMQTSDPSHAPSSPILSATTSSPARLSSTAFSTAAQARDPSFAEPQHEAVVLYPTRYVEIEPAWLAQLCVALAQQKRRIKLVFFGDALQPGRAEIFRAQIAQALHTKAAFDTDTSSATFLGAHFSIEQIAYTPQQQEALYELASCAIFPSSQTPLQQAKCSVKLATTLLRGVPVVASAVGQQAEYGAEGAALLVPAEATPIEFADAIAQLLADPAAQAQMIQKASARLRTPLSMGEAGRFARSLLSEVGVR